MDEIGNLFGVPAAVGFMGLIALGFATMFLTESVQVAVALLFGALFGGIGLLFVANRR